MITSNGKFSKRVFTFSLIALSAIALAGCGGGNKTSAPATDEKSRIVETTEFSAKIPREWDVIEAKDFSSDVQKETVLIFRNNVKNENFTANVNVVKKNLQKTEESLDFARATINRQKNGLLNYKQTKQDLTKMTITGKQFDSYTTSFEAKKDEQSDLVNFFQTYAVKGNSGYIFTGSYSTNESSANVTAVQDIVKSFSLK